MGGAELLRRTEWLLVDHKHVSNVFTLHQQHTFLLLLLPPLKLGLTLRSHEENYTRCPLSLPRRPPTHYSPNFRHPAALVLLLACEELQTSGDQVDLYPPALRKSLSLNV